MGTRYSPVLIAPANSAHISASQVTRECLAQRPANQCLKYQHAAGIAASNALTTPAHSLPAWDRSVTSASTKAEFTTMPTHLAHPSTLPTVLP
ncbi:unnamed protein product [Schistocephalus solidus]|uniref:Uncharacterized protein n=1 Tax=Schistocephalus solidus TaxID=70667 RepID=A0A183TR53_SCHSO|nr:unnamed protein product [Schistocephalus solidus]